MANNYLQFCPTSTGTNLLTNAEYSAAADRTSGNQPGVASSKLVNKALRQSSVVASTLAQTMANLMGVSVLDSGTNAALLKQMTALLTPCSMVTQSFLSGSGTYGHSYTFFASAAASATVGATYTNNGNTYTVLATIASKLQLVCKGVALPEAEGTLTKATGTGDATIDFVAYKIPIYIKVMTVGAGGGGGGGGGGGTSGDGANGGDSTFGVLTGSGGVGGVNTLGQGGTGGAASLGGTAGYAIPGGSGTAAQYDNGANIFMCGGAGGNSILGGGGGAASYNGTATTAGFAGATNSGAGGGGGGGQPSSQYYGAGGGAGGGVVSIIPTPALTYSYGVGAGGAGGAAGASGKVGGAGAAGIIFVEEHYQ